jgi:hypothetical protein
MRQEILKASPSVVRTPTVTRTMRAGSRSLSTTRPAARTACTTGHRHHQSTATNLRPPPRPRTTSLLASTGSRCRRCLSEKQGRRQRWETWTASKLAQRAIASSLVTRRSPHEADQAGEHLHAAGEQLYASASPAPPRWTSPCCTRSPAAHSPKTLTRGSTTLRTRTKDVRALSRTLGHPLASRGLRRHRLAMFGETRFAGEATRM